MYWDEIAEEIEKRVNADLERQYRPSGNDTAAAWKRHIVDVMSEKSRLLRAMGRKQRT